MKRRRWSNLWPAKFIGFWEGLLLEAYLDTIASPPVWTIGFGWTGKIRDKATGKLRPIRAGDRISKRYATRLLARGIKGANRELSRWLEVPVTVRQRMALLSLMWNIGPNGLRTSTLLRMLNEGRYHDAADQFLRWNTNGVEVIEGLTNRRRAERRMFLSKMPQQRRLR